MSRVQHPRVPQRGKKKSLSPRSSKMEALEPRRVLAAPTLGDLPAELNFFSGAQYQLALNGGDTDGDSLTYTVTSDNPDISVSIPKQDNPSGNRSMRITVQGYGEMVFELFEGRAPNTTSRIIDIAESGWYDGKDFHRIIDGFMIQGGSRDGLGINGTGTQFDDEFHADLQFTSTGLLAMAKSGDDTNDSQFFITDVPSSSYPRWLDFNHTIFGKLTSGSDVREAISQAATDSNDRPLTPIVIESVEIFEDTQDAVMSITAADGTYASANVTVTVSDGKGGTASETFTVNALPDSTNDNPFLGTIDPIRLAIDTPYSFQLNATDVEGDTIFYQAELLTETDDITVEVSDTGLVTITPKNEVVGVAEVAFRVGPTADSLVPDSNGDYNEQIVDTQYVTIAIPPGKPVISFASGSDTGAQDGKTSRDNSTGKELYFEIENLQATSQLYVYLQGVETPFEEITRIPQGDGTTNYVATVRLQPGTTLPDGDYTLHAQQTLALGADYGNQLLTSDLSEPFDFNIDTEAPVITSAAVDAALLGDDYFYNVEADDEGDSDVFYELQVPYPSGMTINAATGEIHWTPSIAAGSTQEIVVRAIDGAGNVGTQSFDLTVYAPLEITLVEGDTSADELEPVSFIVEASDPNNQNSSLTITLQDGVLPADADYSLEQLEGNRARFTWNTGEADGPGIYDLVFGATDNANALGRTTIQVTVDEVNQAPEFTTVFDEWTGTEEERIDLQFVASDADLPANELVFDLFGEVPEGAVIGETSGLLSWTPDENDGGQTFEFGVRVTDSGGLTAEHTIVITVVENQKAPVFDPTPAQRVIEGEVLDFEVRAQDPDIPANSIKYELEGDIPAGLTIDADTGRIRWEVPESFLPTTMLQSTLELTVVAREVVPEPEVGQVARQTVELTVVDSLADLVAATLTLTQNVMSDPIAGPDTVSVESTTVTGDETPALPPKAQRYDDRGFFGTQFGPTAAGDSFEPRQEREGEDTEDGAPGDGDQASTLELLLDEIADEAGKSLLDVLLASQVTTDDALGTEETPSAEPEPELKRSEEATGKDENHPEEKQQAETNSDVQVASEAAGEAAQTESAKS